MKVGDLVIYSDEVNTESYFNGRTGIVTRFVQTNWDGAQTMVFLHPTSERPLDSRYLMDDPKYFKVL